MLEVEATISEDELRPIKKLGEGCFATVELCSYHPLDRGHSKRVAAEGALVAVKRLKQVVPGRDPSNPGQRVMHPVPGEWFETFKAEALVMGSFRHANVVACYGCVLDGVQRQLSLAQRAIPRAAAAVPRREAPAALLRLLRRYPQHRRRRRGRTVLRSGGDARGGPRLLYHRWR